MNYIPFDENGNWIPNDSYKEIHRLHQMLTDAGIPHTMKPMMDGWQICYPQDGAKRVVSVIEHYGSYGKDEDLLEIMGLLTKEEEDQDSVLGYLTAEEVFLRIKNHHSGFKPRRSKRKYRKGEPITSLEDLANQEFVYVHDKITHRGWFMSWQFRFAKDMLEKGVLHKAVMENGYD